MARAPVTGEIRRRHGAATASSAVTVRLTASKAAKAAKAADGRTRPQKGAQGPFKVVHGCSAVDGSKFAQSPRANIPAALPVAALYRPATCPMQHVGVRMPPALLGTEIGLQGPSLLSLRCCSCRRTGPNSVARRRAAKKGQRRHRPNQPTRKARRMKGKRKKTLTKTRRWSPSAGHQWRYLLPRAAVATGRPVATGCPVAQAANCAAAVLRCCGAAVLWCCGLHAAGRLLPIRRMNAGHPTLQRRSRSVSNAHLPQGRRFSNLTDGRHVSDLGRIAACRVGTSTSSVSRYSIFISRKADPKGKDEVIRVLVIGKCYSDALVLL